MTITYCTTQAQADVIGSPKFLWYQGGGKIVVYTGADMDIANPPPTQEQLDTTVASQYAKLVALRNMTPAQVQTWVTNNVTDLATAKDAIMTLAIAVGVLARRI